MRLHTETSVRLLEDAYSAMARQLRTFAEDVCPKFDTWETPSESAKRLRAQPLQNAPSSNSTVTTPPARKRRRYHLRTIKTHLLGYYPAYIRRFGTTDSYSTKIVSILGIGSH